MNFLTHLKKTNHEENTRWIVKYNSKGDLREIKQIYKPSEYYAANKHKGKNARPLHNKNALIKILENDKKKNNS
tara:strand:+ start:1293 stop:1514 length:222 start_codon:yes stop_codon:yes gene_type:complete